MNKFLLSMCVSIFLLSIGPVSQAGSPVCYLSDSNDSTDCSPYGSCVTNATGNAFCQCDEKHFGAGCQFDRRSVIEDFVGLEEPARWQQDRKSGLMYRHATKSEREKNHWKPGTFLVEAGTSLKQIANGQPVTIVIPMTVNTSRILDLKYVSNDVGGHFMQLDQKENNKAGISSGRPSFQLYGSDFTETVIGGQNVRDLKGALITAVSVSREEHFVALGHMNRQHGNQTTLDRLKIEGPGPQWFIEPIEGYQADGSTLLALHWTPNNTGISELPQQGLNLCGFPLPNVDDPKTPGSHPCSSPGGGHSPQPGGANECTNTVDDDADETFDIDGAMGAGLYGEVDPMCKHNDTTCNPLGFSSFPDHTHKRESGLYYGLFGGVQWCTRHKSTWKEEMYLRATVISNAFRTESVADPNDPQGAPYNQDNTHFNEFIANKGGSSLMRWSASKCWMLESNEQADLCRNNSANCGPFAPGNQHVYPYGGLASPRTNFSLYQYESWKDLEHAAKLPGNHNMDYPLDLWQYIGYETDEEIGGVDLWGGKASTLNPATIVNGAYESSTPYTEGPHEFGHVFGCTHCDMRYVSGTDLQGEPEVGRTLMVTETESEACNEDGGAKIIRFSTRCSLRMINDSYNKFNRRHGIMDDPSKGPTFGYSQ